VVVVVVVGYGCVVEKKTQLTSWFNAIEADPLESSKSSSTTFFFFKTD